MGFLVFLWICGPTEVDILGDAGFSNGMGSTVQLLACAGRVVAVHSTLDLNLRRLRSLDEDKISGGAPN